MKKFSTFNLLSIVLLFLNIACASGNQISEVRETKILPPEDLYGKLFYDVQSNNIFSDSKTFVDAVPKYRVKEIRNRYDALNNPSTSEMQKFLQRNFKIPSQENVYQTDSSSISTHISKLWEVLKRPADERTSGTLIPLPHPYIVPGGRFREVYYWDSYFTMLGLQEDGEFETIKNMVDNFSYLIDAYGFIPNGNRTYYLSRSQPPFYAKMVELLAEIEGEEIYVDYLPFLVKEYKFWMRGAENLSRTNLAERRVVKLPEGEILNRYWDDKVTPRPESYREDVETADEALKIFPDKSREVVYRNLRAAAESGWDFSSRWLSPDEEGKFHLSTIHTTDILPVDLNSLLFNLELTISIAYYIEGSNKKAREYYRKSEVRKQAMIKYFWSEEEKYFLDFNLREHQHTDVLSLAGVYPLFFGLAEKDQAKEVAEKIENVFLKPGGVLTTPYQTGQQWDAPNGWAPLQFITIEGLRAYGHQTLASEIKNRWLRLNEEVYKRTYKLAEKYNVEDLSKEGGGGEYPTQDGFGWTNGVYQKLSKE